MIQEEGGTKADKNKVQTGELMQKVQSKELMGGWAYSKESGTGKGF